MDDSQVNDATNIAKLISDHQRVKILGLIEPGNLSVGEIAEALESTQPAISHHIALLKAGGLINPNRVGKNNYYAHTKRGSKVMKSVRTFAAISAS
jgi:DNA-binding transcriptional ArsR family regulator